MKADLHLHSNKSDGKYSPQKLIELCIKKDLKVIAITDHDEICSLDKSLIKKYSSQIEIITGIELSCHIKKKEIHLLGYFFDSECEELMEKISSFKKHRKDRFFKIISKLNGLGIDLKEKDVEANVKSEIYGRLHVARAMVDTGFVKNSDDAFLKFLGNGKAAYVPKERFDVKSAISLIKSCGGVTSVAHAASSSISSNQLLELQEMGIDGLEVYHPKHYYHSEDILKAFCKRHNLVVTGGSDFHGFEDKEFDNLGTKYASLEDLERLRDIANKRK